MTKENLQTVRVVLGDITTLAVDAVVNSANRSLLGGAGVDRAIHRAAGRELFDYCLELNGCPVGQSVITPGFNLRVPYVIHSVGPVWMGGWNNEDEELASAYKTALDIALEKNLKSIAFPCISRGVHKYPTDRAAAVAWGVVKSHPYKGEVILCCFAKDDFEAYVRLLGGMEVELQKP